jgi:hypothetical protein
VDTDGEVQLNLVDAEGFAFVHDHDGSLTLRSAIFQAIGAASTCWDTLDKAGVFHSEQAKAIGDAVCALIIEKFPAAERECSFFNGQEAANAF